MSKVALERLAAKFPDAVLYTHDEHGDETAYIKPDRLLDVCAFLRDDDVTSFELLSDLTVADYHGIKEPRFEVVYHLYSVSKNHRLRLKVELDEQDLRLSSVVGLWKSALWAEREAFDLYGVNFLGHPDLRRILLYPEFKGHPLRKDYELEARQPRIPPRPGRQHL